MKRIGRQTRSRGMMIKKKKKKTEEACSGNIVVLGGGGLKRLEMPKSAPVMVVVGGSSCSLGFENDAIDA